ncbi:hypothetical protein [Sphingopyxis panaciterrae]
MSVIFLPVLRTAVTYSVSFGRRWTILEQMILLDLVEERRTVSELAVAADLPDRLVVEALINLLRSNWIEMRASDAGAYFAATAAGKRRAADQTLPDHVERGEKWTSLCFDRVTGSWLRSDDLDVVYERDLPNSARPLEARYQNFNAADGDFRDLLYLQPLETLEPDEPRLRTPARPYARFEVTDEAIVGLPDYAPMKLRRAILDAAEGWQAASDEGAALPKVRTASRYRDTIEAGDIFVGGPAQRTLLRESLQKAGSTIIIHSCFVNPKTLAAILPDLTAAAKRKVKVELLWGLQRDDEASGPPASIVEARRLLDGLPFDEKQHITLSARTSGSHAKLIVYDDAATGNWVSVISSCNLLSTNFDALDVSLRTRSPGIAAKLLSWLTTTQQPAVGGWSHQARRINTAWGTARRRAAGRDEEGEHQLSLLVDTDHHACLRKARDEASTSLLVACDLYGLAAETSVIVPTAEAAKDGVDVQLLYSRASKLLREEGRTPDATDLAKRGLRLLQVDELHGKFLLWDEESLAATSFNWLSTAVDGARARGAEFGLLAEGPELKRNFGERLAEVEGFDEARAAILGGGGAPLS